MNGEEPVCGFPDYDHRRLYHLPFQFLPSVSDYDSDSDSDSDAE